MAEYRYGMRLRGFSPCCQPKEGLIRREDDTTGKYHDIIVYDRELTEKELSEYELDDLATEAVEVCPYCGAENVFKNWDVEKQGYIAVCQQCGREIFLCDECLHAEDNEGQRCNWREVQEPDSNVSGRCFRGETKKACGGEP